MNTWMEYSYISFPFLRVGFLSFCTVQTEGQISMNYSPPQTLCSLRLRRSWEHWVVLIKELFGYVSFLHISKTITFELRDCSSVFSRLWGLIIMVHIESKESPTILPFHVVRECVNFFTLSATASPPHPSLHSRLSNSKQQTFFHVGWVSSIQQPFSKNYFADITIKTPPSRDQCSKSYLNFFKACVLSKLRGSQML